MLTYDNPCLNCGLTNDRKSGLITCRICIGCGGGGEGPIGGGGGHSGAAIAVTEGAGDEEIRAQRVHTRCARALRPSSGTSTLR